MSRRKSIFLSSQEAQPNPKQLDELSNEIDQNLRTIAQIHTFSPTEKSLLVKGAFVKPNKSAFHHVVHYLVMIINAVYFRKRFRWPILSLVDESEFRTQALAYFNECHSKYKWNFGPFKMQIVLFPGGIELMKIIIELSKLAMNAVLKQSDCIHLINGRCITSQEAHARLRTAEESFEQLELLRSKVQSMADPLKEKTQRLNDLLCQILSHTSITQDMIDAAFLSAWEKKQYEIVNEKILPLLDSLEAITSKYDSFQQYLVMTKPRQLHFDKEKLNAYGLLKKSPHFDPQIDYDKLLKWLENAMPDLINAIYFKPPWSVSKLMHESDLLSRIILRADDLLERIDAVLKNSDDWRIIRQGQQTKSTMLSYLNEKLILTPAIDCVPKKTRRIAIWEAIPAVDSPINPQRNAEKTTEDDLDTFSDFAHYTSMRTATAKLNPLSMLNSAMKRNGFTRCKSPHRTFAHSSPNRLTNNNMEPVFSSTMICKDNQTSRIALSPLRKTLF